MICSSVNLLFLMSAILLNGGPLATSHWYGLGGAGQTLRSLENGSGGRLNSFIRVMKALDKEEWLGTFRPAVRISPMDIAKRAGKQRLRATRSVIAQSSSQKDHI